MLFEREKEEFREEAKDNELKLSPETAFFRDSDMKEFYAVVGELKEKFRVVFLMRYREGLRYADIADMLRCSERTVKWRMKRAIEIIVDELKDRGVI
jgi:RNA polymerase sigma factor (sigma-70 family)